MNKNGAKKGWIKVIRGFFMALGVFFFLMLLLALTPLPYYMHYNLGIVGKEEPSFDPDVVVMFGGSGMPSRGNLMRLYYTAEYANKYHLPVIIAHPQDSLCHAEMRRYLVQSGVPSSDISFMTQGGNTRAQALGMMDECPQLASKHLLVVTSTPHLKRAVKSMEKVGFQHIKGIAAHEATVDFDLSVTSRELKGNKIIPAVRSTKIRYNFWNYLTMEITCLREYTALSYYKIKGWI